MRVIASVVLVLGVAFGLRAVAAAGQKEPSVSDGWVKAPAPGDTTAAAFATVENPGMYAIYLLSATTDAADKVEFREAGPDGALKAQAIAEVTVPAYESVTMSPKGLQLLLVGLKRPLKEGDMVPLTLTTELGLKLYVAAPVRQP
jgi:copper(I)-binding protein